MKRSTERFADQDESVSLGYGYAIVIVGTSWGGLDALRTIVSALPPEYELPTVVVQHRHRDTEALLARLLQDETKLNVCEIEDKQPIEGGHVFVAPADYHTMIDKGHFALSVDEPVRYSRPSIDVTMMSAADAYRHRTVGVVLTGANADGARGLRSIADAGGLAVVQQPATAEVPTMPSAAVKSVPTARVFALDRIAAFLGNLPSRHTRARST